MDQNNITLSIGQLAGMRGIKIYPRSLGQAIIGGASSGIQSTTDLDSATFRHIETQDVQDAVVGPPDAEGAVLIQLARDKLDWNLNAYNQDAKSACPRTMALPIAYD